MEKYSIWTPEELGIRCQDYITWVKKIVADQIRRNPILFMPTKENLARKHRTSVVIIDNTTCEILGNFSAIDCGDRFPVKAFDLETLIIDQRLRWLWMSNRLFSWVLQLEILQWRLITIQTLNQRVFRWASNAWFVPDKCPNDFYQATIDALINGWLQRPCIINNLIFMTNKNNLHQWDREEIDTYLTDTWVFPDAHVEFPIRTRLLNLCNIILKSDNQVEIDRIIPEFVNLFEQFGDVLNSWMNKWLYWTEYEFMKLKNIAIVYWEQEIIMN